MTPGKERDLQHLTVTLCSSPQWRDLARLQRLARIPQRGWLGLGQCSGSRTMETSDADTIRLLLPFWLEAWLRLALSNGQEFLLCVGGEVTIPVGGRSHSLLQAGRGLAGTLATLLAFSPTPGTPQTPRFLSYYCEYSKSMK